MLARISALDPTTFENLTYDCMKAIGLRNVVWRTPGADGGRDIEGVAYSTDLSGHESVDRWYIECKFYTNSIDWPTIWKKVAYADVQNADYLLLVTNSNPSPACETKIEEWNASKRRPKIRIWRGYELAGIIRVYRHIGVIYGLVDDQVAVNASALPLHSVISRLTQAAYVSAYFGSNDLMALEASAAISELVSQRMSDFLEFGFARIGELSASSLDFDWVNQTGSASAWENAGIRALIALARFSGAAQTIDLTIDEHHARLHLRDCRVEMQDSASNDLNLIAHWTFAEVLNVDGPNRLIQFERRTA